MVEVISSKIKDLIKELNLTYNNIINTNDWENALSLYSQINDTSSNIYVCCNKLRKYINNCKHFIECFNIQLNDPLYVCSDDLVAEVNYTENYVNKTYIDVNSFLSILYQSIPEDVYNANIKKYQ